MDTVSPAPLRTCGQPRSITSWHVSARDSGAPITPRDLVASLRGAPGAYVHVPFCERLCPFCPYNKELYRPAREARYFAALREEARRYAEALGAGALSDLFAPRAIFGLMAGMIAVALGLLPFTQPPARGDAPAPTPGPWPEEPRREVFDVYAHL